MGKWTISVISDIMQDIQESPRLRNVIMTEKTNDELVTREEFDALTREFYKLERTVYGLQQMLGKAATYQGKERGRLPR